MEGAEDTEGTLTMPEFGAPVARQSLKTEMSWNLCFFSFQISH